MAHVCLRAGAGILPRGAAHAAEVWPVCAHARCGSGIPPMRPDWLCCRRCLLGGTEVIPSISPDALVIPPISLLTLSSSLPSLS
eukprot:365322-Chlamydomonas_euryale.AAC.2